MFRRAASLIVKNVHQYNKCVTNNVLSKNTSAILLNQINNNQLRNYAAQVQSVERGTVAVILSGCGYLDGTEITEAVSTMVHLTKKGYKLAFFAPDIEQEETYDHVTKTLDKNEVRNIRVEGARIARQNVLKLEQYRPQAFEALVIPGGFGVAKNLSNYAEDPINFKIHPEVEKAITSTHDAKVPIAMCCIAPVLAAKLIPGCTITLGDSEPQTTENAKTLGANCVQKSVEEIVIDKDNKLVTSPAYMGKNPAAHEVFDGIGKMIDALVQLTGSKNDDSGEINFGVLEEVAIKKIGKEKFQQLKEQYYGAGANAGNTKPTL
ncbi:hypothetical protein ABK040_015129 [Willaertia magna]